MTRSPIALALLASITLPVAALAQPAASQKPRILVIATGGTISNMGADSARRTGQELVTGIPALARVADVRAEQFSNVASGSVTEEMWRRLAARIRAATNGTGAYDGVIVTHGTDTMEETAYFLDLTVGGCAPVIVTGAMRRAVDPGADGPANLLNSVRTAASPDARGRGTLVLMDDLIFDAHDVTKTNTTRVDTFRAPWLGPVGVADPDSIIFHRRPRVRGAAGTACFPPAFDLGTLGVFPRVDVVESYIGADSVIVDALVTAGAKGIVIAGVGRGGTTPAQSRAIDRAVKRGVVVLVSSRTGSGRVGLTPPSDYADWKPGEGVVLGAGDLNPQKARVLLMLALAKTSDVREIARMVREY
jgi:L-asparaginase